MTSRAADKEAGARTTIIKEAEVHLTTTITEVEVILEITIRGRGNNRGVKRSRPSRGGYQNQGMENYNIFYTCKDKQSVDGPKHTDTIEKFIADSGATEHLSRSKLIFKDLNENKIDKIKCANSNSEADLKSQGVGSLEIKLNDDKSHNLKDVICVKNLSVNLLSLRKLVEQGLNVYLNDKIIDIFNPVTCKSFLTGVYKKPF